MLIRNQAHSVLSSQPTLPDILYCVAGGTPNECGYLLDLEPEVFERAMNNNYYSSLYPTQAVLKLWTDDDKDAAVPSVPKLRKIVYVNSSASLVPAPGYLAYSGTCCSFSSYKIDTD
jgi:3-dehydrosphinganine reductase